MTNTRHNNPLTFMFNRPAAAPPLKSGATTSTTPETPLRPCTASFTGRHLTQTP